MSAYKNCKSAKAEAIVKKIKDVVDELVDVITQDDDFHRYCFDGAVSERAKRVEFRKKKFVALWDEYEKMMEQLDSVKKGLSQLNLDYNSVVEENKCLEKAMQLIKSDDHVDGKEINDSRLKLKLYKEMTGIYFDLNNSGNELTGFAAVKGDTKHHSGFVPFMLNKDQPEISGELWAKIGEALNNELPNSQSLHKQNEIK